MSSFEWFFRMENAIRISLPEISDEFDEFELLFDTNTTEAHPSYSFQMATNDQLYEICVIHFDPVNQEFYAYHYNDEVELDSKVLFYELDDMLQFIYDSSIEFIDDLNEMSHDIYQEDYDEFVEDYPEEFDVSESNYVEDDDDFSLPAEEKEDIHWISNDKHLHIENNNKYGNNQYSIHLKIGVDQNTGDGILYRNVIAKNGDEIEETEYIPFKMDEASYFIELIQDYLDYFKNQL